MTRKPPSPISEFGPSSPTTAKINWIPEKVLSLIASVELVKITSDLGKTDWASVTELWSQEHFSDALNHTKASLQRKLSAQYAMKDRPQKSWSGIPRTLVELDLKYPDLMSTFRQRLASTQGIASKVSAPEYLSDNINVQTSFEAIDESVDETIGPDCIGIDFIALTNSFRYTDEFQWREPVIEIPRVEHDTMLDHQADESIHLSKEVVAKRKRQILHECRETWNTVPYTPIKESEAHILQAPLLFRFYDLAAEHVENSPREKGFVAGFFKNLKTRIPEPLPCQLDMLFVDFLKHINKEKFPSKVISTSSDFIWVLCQALCVLANNSNPDIRMSIIDAHKAAGPGGKKLYHALPYTRQLRKRRAFDEGKWLYHKVSNQEYCSSYYSLLLIFLLYRMKFLYGVRSNLTQSLAISQSKISSTYYFAHVLVVSFIQTSLVLTA